MTPAAKSEDEVADVFLSALGQRVRNARKAAGLSRRALSDAAGISERYLAQLEGGTGNASISLLNKIALALDVPLASLIADDDPLIAQVRAATPDQRNRVAEALSPGQMHGGRIALIGLRGAGKTTLGTLAAKRLGLPFFELNEQIEATAGISVTELFALYGQEGYRELESQAVARLALGPPMILAVAGGIVSEPRTFEQLLQSFRTVWLKARPEEHMQRVRDQGDERPMADNPGAMGDLRRILMAREAHYARADLAVDTSGRTVRESLNELLATLA